MHYLVSTLLFIIAGLIILFGYVRAVVDARLQTPVHIGIPRAFRCMYAATGTMMLSMLFLYLGW